MIHFTFKNDSGIEYNSLYDFGIYLVEKPSIPRAERRVNLTVIEGRHGSLTDDKKLYDDIAIPIKCIMLDKDIFNDKLDILNAWLNGEGGTLTFSFLFDRFFKVKTIKSYEIKESSGILGEFEINLICEPFRYTSGEVISITHATSIYNPGTIESEPLFKVYGSGDISISLNSEIFYLNDLTDYVVVDTEIGNCYRDTQPMESKMIGKYPILKTGENQISFTGNISKVEINPRWRWL